MRVEFIQEPELEFGGGGRHIDARFGLSEFGPLDAGLPAAPSQIRLGLVGNRESVEGFARWTDRCRRGVAARNSKQPHLFPKFPGFGEGEMLGANVVTDAALERTLPEKAISRLSAISEDNEVVREATEMVLEHLAALAEKGKADALVFAVPFALLKRMWSEARKETNGAAARGDAENPRLDLHDLLKARAMRLGVPVQLVLPSTYDDTKRLRQVGRDAPRRPQDEATRAWNLYVALFYKAGGVPWRLVRTSTDLAVCYVGVSFFNSLDGGTVQTSSAQVFNERGEGIILRGAAASVSKEDRQPHLDADGARELLSAALLAYRGEHRHHPARVVLCKTSSFSRDELEGFRAALQENRIDAADLLNIGESHTRLFRAGEYPPLRGTFLSKDDRRHILYTRGSVDFYETYPGMYVPRPLAMTLEETESTPSALAEELLALTKMNWNNTQFDNSEPIMVTAARKVGRILKNVDASGTPQSRYSFYM